MFKRYVVLFNPASTHAARSRRRIHELQRIVGKDRTVIIETAADQNQADYLKHLDDQTLFCIAAGDGTVGAVVSSLVDEQYQTPILPLWGGNANDLAIMLNGSPRASLRQILKQGRSVEVRPLFCKLVYPDGRSETKIAASYLSFGATAYAARRLNKPHHRLNPLHLLPGGRAISEMAAGFNGLMEAPRFGIRSRGRTRHVYDRIFTNGSRFAKTDLLPLKLTDQLYYTHTVRHKRLSRLPRLVARFMYRQSRLGTLRTSPLAFRCTENTLAQFDGESVEIPAGTKVTVGLFEQPFFALSTKMKAAGHEQ